MKTIEKKYDIFISYSRKDLDEVKTFVRRICEHIPNLKIWFDITGIESGDEFDVKIMRAIESSRCVLYALSNNSLQSPWTKDEVIYAKNTGIRVIPILLKDAELKDWFLFKFGRIDYINSQDDSSIKKLVVNLTSWIEENTMCKTSNISYSCSDVPTLNDNVVNRQESLHDNHDFVDLGLSVKWATCNIGANRPEECGDYFAWGEIKEKSLYRQENYLLNANPVSLTSSEDAATVQWGNSWRIPSIDEQIELINQCTWEWMSINGVNGYKVIGENGNSIFLPATGYKYNQSLCDINRIGYYWSSSLNINTPEYAFCMGFYNGEQDWNGNNRHYGQPIRPVCP